MDTSILFISSIMNLFIAGVFMGLAYVVLKGAEAEGAILWMDLGRTLLLIGACLVAQSLVVASVAMIPDKAFKFLWFVVFILFAVTGFLTARYCYRTNKLLEGLLGGGDD